MRVHFDIFYSAGKFIPATVDSDVVSNPHTLYILIVGRHKFCGQELHAKLEMMDRLPYMETFLYLAMLTIYRRMESKFEILFLEEARQFLLGLDEKTRAKILYNIDKAKILNDPKLFKKLTGDIWEFRTKYNGLQYRLLAFWDKTLKVKTLVISTHGFLKKVDKVSASEIEKANELRKLYLRQRKK